MDHPSCENPMTKRVIIKNLIVLCLGVVLLFTAYDGLAMVQSTMNRKHGIGLISQAVIYASFCAGSLTLPKYVIKKLGSKRTFALSMVTYVPYITSNFYPHWVLMIPSSVIIGAGASLLWGSQANYLNDIAVMYACWSKKENVSTFQGESTTDSLKKTNSTNPANHGLSTTPSSNDSSNHETRPSCNIGLHQKKHTTMTSVAHKDEDVRTVPKIVESTTALFFGFHGMAFLSSYVWTNLLTYFVLKRGASETSSNATCACGADFCNVESECFVRNVDSPSDGTRYLLSGVCTSLGLLSILVVVLFLDPVETNRKEVNFSLELMSATCRIMKKKELLLLIPASVFLGQAKGFYTGDITKSYIGCAWGSYHVPLVSMFYGLSCGLSSMLSGWLVKRLGRPTVFSAAEALALAACIFLLLWTPDRRQPAMFFLAAVLWGAHVGMSWAQLRALHGMLFKADEESAFAAFHAWYSLGFCLSFSYSSFLCTNVKIYVLLIMSVFGYIGYISLERMLRKTLKY